MIACRIASYQYDKVTFLKIVQLNCASPGTNDTCEPDTTCLVAVVTAIVDVIGAVNSSHQLQQKSIFLPYIIRYKIFFVQQLIKYDWYLNSELCFPEKKEKSGIIVVKKNVVDKAFNSPPSSKTGYTIFSCEVHFARLPDDMNEADLIEGVGQEFNRRHFNCFNVLHLTDISNKV